MLMENQHYVIYLILILQLFISIIKVNTAKSSTYEKWYKYDDNGNLLYIIDNNGDKITDTDNTIPAPLDIQYDDNGDIVYARYNDTESFYDYEYFDKE